MEKETFNEKLLRKELKDLQGAYDIALNEMNMKDKEIEKQKRCIKDVCYALNFTNKELKNKISELQAENEDLVCQISELQDKSRIIKRK